ncbi:globin-like [Dermacentor andersoni]|uniref:globin-like n=1 Tax=Dermacentor andersoni TaxID=34620 RepID=UPI002417D724|nr:cytoglobin-2-like [Dermacentor andersoni]
MFTLPHCIRVPHETVTKKNMGNSLRRVATSSGHTGLTYRERKHVRDTWQAFCRAKPDYGVLIFVEFFQRYPTYLQLFQPFGDLPLKDLVCNHRFRAHGSAVGHQFTAVVDTLDEPDVMIELIRKNAIKHALKPGVKAEHFESLLHVMLETMQTRCPEHFTPDVIVAWTKLFDVSYNGGALNRAVTVITSFCIDTQCS